MSELVAPALLLAHDPEALAALSDVELLALVADFDVWARPEQRIPSSGWTYYGFHCGRGWGKTFSIPEDITRRVIAGELREIGLMAPTDDRVEDVQIKALLSCAPPWFAPEYVQGKLRWPNGAIGNVFTSQAPGRPRSENLHASWLTEIVDWHPRRGLEAFANITTATRVAPGLVYWDTTSRGRSAVIDLLFDLHTRDPGAYRIVRGEMFDNMLLSAAYLQTEALKYHGQEFDEEVRGRKFAEASGAIFRQTVINETRVAAPPAAPDLRLVAVDPALSTHEEADVFGIGVASRARGAVYFEADLSGHYSPEEWGDIVVAQCADAGCAGVIVERNRVGDNPAFVVRSRAGTRRHTTRTLSAGEEFAPRIPGVIQIREVVQTESKGSRGAAAWSAMQAGNVHLVGTWRDLEGELTTYVPGASRSPNRYDAFCQLAIELLGLARDARPDQKREVAHAAEAARVVQREVLRRTTSRRVGL